VAKLSEVHLGKPLKEIELAALIRDLVQGAIKFEIEMPVEMMMVGKSLMTVEGIGKSIYPDLDVMEEARPFFLKLIWQRYSPDKIGLKLLRAASKLSGAASDLPVMAAEVLDDLRRGQLRVQAEDPGLGRAAERLGRRIALGLIGASLIAAGTALYLGNRPWAAAGTWGVAGFIGFIAWGTLPQLRRR
jgi:ubiquinone biosynthesis protein